jgi:membrane protein DedA with SNARE-associated domain
MLPLHISPAVGYAGLAAFVGAESAGLPVPGETSLIAAAVLASQGHLSIQLVIAVAAGAAIVGDNLGYLFGRRGGRWLLTRTGWAEDRRQRLLARGEVFFERHGGKAVFLARWLPWLRATAAWLAGASRMRWPRFLLWNALGGVAWATSIGLAACFLGKAAATVIGATSIVFLVLVGALSVGAFLFERVRQPAS